MDRTQWGKKWAGIWKQYRYVLLAAGLGCILLLWPFGKRQKGNETAERPINAAAEQRSVAEMEERMERILSRIDGVGELHLLLTMESSGERCLAEDTEVFCRGTEQTEVERRSEPILLSGSDGEEVVTLWQQSPVYRGALVVCSGADRAEVRLAVTQAVAVLTGLGTDRITVVSCKS